MEFELAESFFSIAWECHNKGNRTVVVSWDCPTVRQLKEQREAQELKWSLGEKYLWTNLLCLFAELSYTRSLWLWILRAAGITPALSMILQETENKLEPRIEKRVFGEGAGQKEQLSTLESNETNSNPLGACSSIQALKNCWGWGRNSSPSLPPLPSFTPSSIMHNLSYFITGTLTLMCYVYAALSGLVLSAALTSLKIA